MSVTISDSIRKFFGQEEVPLVLSDAKDPENPLILVNKSFCALSGFSRDEILGQNCRFMHGEGTQTSSRNAIRGDFAGQRDTSVLIRNYRKTGEAFDNFLYIFGVYDREDTLAFRIGSQFAVPKSNRASAFEDHADKLLAGLDKINKSGDIPRHRLIDLEPVASLNANSLLYSRLRCLKAA